ncbi:uncharacterized protein HMPREF1541_03279 [Cyphellophora europaea CBS 101466]|uniref:FAD dependent oxidoreductase domain-containing protein n=1 Tax=Cyphellophora europaea (strain CBS 101466) TaxID=1220924 RepID=W2S074_CYPE1|nr:uncharacterized protein HMPREF1541_03279 [Cyphellophora europaea CBS 101466]ETN41344.1 hypothetical protein HMPREF1541_03279 [Cyphellophora europaea CBS 101466]
MASPPLAKNDPIAIVGAGIFGLSTALHLARRGYTSVTIFDKQPYHETHYDYFKGCDAASADCNKIFRCAYGKQSEYMRMSLEARDEWMAWNEELQTGKLVPPGMSTRDCVFVGNGNLSLTEERELPEFEVETVRNMERLGWGETQLVTTDKGDLEVAKRKGFEGMMDPFRRGERAKSYLGVLDTLGGTNYADKACRFALAKVVALGVKTVFGEREGTFREYVYESGKVSGIRTLDGHIHKAARVVMACGGWTPSLVPELDHLCETTAGSVVIFRIPKDSPLMERYSAKNFPSWTWNVRDGPTGGLYGFPVTEDGLFKIGYRGEKFTNPKVQRDGKERSVPATRYTTEEQMKQIPQQAWKVIQHFLQQYTPELLQEPGVKVEISRICWYTDSWDNHYVIDFVPELDRRVLIATGGSGHAFKYLPNIGKYIADVLEGKESDRELLQKWRWRSRADNPTTTSPIVNTLMEGQEGPRVLRKQKLTQETLVLPGTAHL